MNIVSDERTSLVSSGASAVAYAVPPPGIEHCLSAEEKIALGEVTDAADRLLLCMPPDQALCRKLRLRVCAVALRNGDGKVILHRTSDFGGEAGHAPGRRRPPPNVTGRSGRSREAVLLWDLYTGHVLAGEAWESAALRLLEMWAGAAGSRLVRLADIDGVAAGGAHIRYYGATLASGLFPKHAPEDMLETDGDELAGLAENIPELLSRSLLPAVRAGILFPKCCNPQPAPSADRLRPGGEEPAGLSHP